MNYRYIKQSTGKAATRPTVVRLVIATVALLASTNWLTTAQAQFGRINRGEAMAQEQILLAPRSLTRLLREGKTAIEEMRYSDGIASLGALLLQEPREDLPEEALRQDYFTEAAGESYYKNSVRSEALRLLGSIPEEGRKILEIQYGVSARQALQAAVEARNIEAITDVTRKYYHTEAGYDASILLAQDKLIRGYPIAAAGILERLSIYPAARKRFGAQLVGEVAATWMQAGRTDLAVRALDEGVKQFAGASILVGNRQVTLDKTQAWAKLLNQVYAQQPQAGERALDAWLMSGGQPDRNGTASAGLPMPMAAWHMTLHRDRSDEETVTMLAGRQNQTTTALLPKLEARMLGDVVLAKTATANVFAIDLETGLRKWPFYKDSLPVSFAPRAPNLAIDSDEVFVHNNLRNRIWGSSAFGQFTVDSNQLYYITSSEDQRLMQPTFNFQRVGSAPIYNMLIGVSLQGEGKEMWQVGGEDSLSEPELAGAYFLGPPTSFEGDLYALVEINMETRLVVLDARTGKLQWAQQLSLSPMAPIRSDPLRQSQALTPSISDAIIVCPVGNGAIIAVDLLTRSLLWGKQYVTNSLPA
ncbi:MAG: PQQ-like beta-propeller repeat protein, partial [Pirellulaceae bacterium]|nr:PQQ-like beta-propeller repeat protein [Pirellulaceae bacterium]